MVGGIIMQEEYLTIKLVMKKIQNLKVKMIIMLFLLLVMVILMVLIIGLLETVGDQSNVEDIYLQF